MNLTIALNYGGRDEVARATKRLAREVAAGRLDPEAVDAESLAKYLDTYVLPDPDLVIRTSGEARISNFLLWQSAYAEYEFIDTLWQDHLYGMDSLREGVHLRSYGQKDPLIEYKNEAFAMFQELMDNIKNETLNNLFRSQASLMAM